ncbi:MAG: radical SAM protein [Candidatus Margulisbacteria bacterium]|jgi:hypothetical protein|nr:radical SAM protein [Candidatus Margulisiibacteriota bacterium]
MNIALTTRCNKNCSFCFARAHRQESSPQDMALADFQRLVELALQDSPPQPLKLLGGEPTIHPQFVEMLDFLTRKNVRATLISNLLYTDARVRARLYQAALEGVIDGGLANAAELEIDNHLEIFKANFTALQEACAKHGRGYLTAGITLSRRKSAAEETAYVEYLAGNLEIACLRLSLDFQAENKKDEFFINNKEQGEKILAIVHKCLDLRIPPSWDCKLFPCMFEPKTFQKDIIGFINSLRTGCPVDGAPFDVFPDMSYIHCYPARILCGKNILKFSRISEAQGEIAFLKKALRGLSQHSLPDACRDCGYYQTGQCDSLCPGCQEITAPFLVNQVASSTGL